MIVHARHLLQILSAISHINAGAAAFHADKLVNGGVHLHSDVTAYGNAHQRQLKIMTGPKRRAEILIHLRRVVNIKNERFASVVTNFGMVAAGSFSHKSTSELVSVSVYARKESGVIRCNIRKDVI